jgi:hypothetical protein
MSQKKLAALLRNGATQIVVEWINAVRGDDRIKSDDDLTIGGLVDHVPMMIEEICENLEHQKDPVHSNSPEARVHAYTRYRQGFRARDLISEASYLRLVLHNRLGAALEGQSEIDARAVMAAIRSVNQYIDEELRYAMAIYSEAALPSDPSEGTK